MKMYRIILIIFLISSGLAAQQLPLYSQYMFDNYLINPAVSGTHDYTMVNGSIRQQWNGFDKNSVNAVQDGVTSPIAPLTISLSGSHSFGDHVSAGGMYLSDEFLGFKNQKLQFSGAYRFRFSENLNMSLSIGLYMQTLKLFNSYVEPWSENDPLWTAGIGSEESDTYWDGIFGLYIYNDRFDFGLSIENLRQGEYDDIGNYLNPIYADDEETTNNGIYTDNRAIRHLFLHSSYDFQIDWANSLSIVPSMLLKSTFVTKPQLDLNLKVIYWDFFWLAASFRTSDNVIAPMVGINTEKLCIGYSYDISNSALASVHQNTHSISLGIYFSNTNDNKHVRKRNRFSELRLSKPGGWFYWYPKSKW